MSEPGGTLMKAGPLEEEWVKAWAKFRDHDHQWCMNWVTNRVTCAVPGCPAGPLPIGTEVKDV